MYSCIYSYSCGYCHSYTIGLVIVVVTNEPVITALPVYWLFVSAVVVVVVAVVVVDVGVVDAVVFVTTGTLYIPKLHFTPCKYITLKQCNVLMALHCILQYIALQYMQFTALH